MGARHREKDKPGAYKTRKLERLTQICKPGLRCCIVFAFHGQNSVHEA